MTSSLDVRQKQRAVIEFLVSEGEPPKQIFERLVNVYGDASLAYSTVKKWVSRIKHEEDDPSLSSLQDRPRSGRPSSAVNPGNNDKVEKLIRDDRRITIDDIAERVGVSHGSAVNIVNRRHRLKGIHSRPNTNRTGAEGLSFYYPRLLYCLDQMLAVMLLSQHRVSSSKTVRPRAPCGARCIGHIVSTWSAVCSEAPHSQFGEGARPHLCMDEWNRPTPVRRRLSLTQAARGKPIPTGLTLVPGTKARSLEAFSQYSAFHL